MSSSVSVSLLAVIKKSFSAAIKRAFPKLPTQHAEINPSNPKFGDYQCNNAMGIFNRYKGDAALPGATVKDVAEAIDKNLTSQDRNMFDTVIAPNGFITLKFKTDFINGQGVQLLKNGLQGVRLGNTKRVAVDFSSPNIAKEMHVGHLRSTIIGESICRVLEFCGHDVERINHVGDWGTQFGMLIEYMKEKYPNFLNEMPDISDLQSFYKAAKLKFDEDEDFKKRAQMGVVNLQKGDKFARQAWQVICDVSRKAFQKIYDRLDITLEERGESWYNEMIPPLIKELEARGMVENSTTEKGTAKVIRVPKISEIPLMVQK